MVGYGKALLAIGVAVATVACTTSSGTPRVGYDGKVPLFAFQDGYVEDRSPGGPVSSWAGEQTNIPGDPRYQFVPGAEQWYTFEGPRGPEGKTGVAGLQGPQGEQGVAGLPGPQGVAGLMGPSGTEGVAILEGPGHRRTAVTAAPSSEGVRQAEARPTQ